MSYEWDFFTTELVGARACFRGPMTDIEIQMSQPFIVLSNLELLRIRLLDNIVDSTADAVRTRECLLRVVNGDLGPLVPRAYANKTVLQALICEKKNSISIDADVSSYAYPTTFEDGARLLMTQGTTQQTVESLLSALNSQNALLRVAARCAIILTASYIEMDA